jgi:hypothetical protein
MADFLVLVFSFLLLIFATRPLGLPVLAGKHRPVPATADFRLAILFPLGGMVSIVAIVRLIGLVKTGLCGPCSRLSYSLIITPFIGWVMTFIGLFGLKSFAKLTKHLSKALVVISVVCGPLLLGLGLFQIVMRVKR